VCLNLVLCADISALEDLLLQRMLDPYALLSRSRQILTGVL